VSNEREKGGVLKSWIDTHKPSNFIIRDSERLTLLLALEEVREPFIDG
jgi:hypothetical protein